MTGILFALLDIPVEDTDAYNRWYDLDHLPEHVAKDDVLWGRRYVATRAERQADGVRTGAATAGHPPYATVYALGGASPLDDPQVAAGWTELDRTLVRAGRFWRGGSVATAGRWALTGARARSSCPVRSEAVCNLAHRGIVVALGRATGSEREAAEAAGRWWEQQLGDPLLEVDGVLAVLAFRPVGRGPADRLLHILLCEGEPAEVMPAVAATGAGTTAAADGSGPREPHRGGPYEPLALLPYRAIHPFEYGFAW